MWMIVCVVECGDCIVCVVYVVVDGVDCDWVFMSLFGVGVWILVEICICVFGDLDVVSVGDYYLVYEVGYVLMGKCIDDMGMIEFLVLWVGYW